MIDPKLSRSIRKGKTSTVFVSVTLEDMGKPVSIFDEKLHDLSNKLREIIPNVNFQCNGTTETYQIYLPEMDEKACDLVIELFNSTSLRITEKKHFGGLY